MKKVIAAILLTASSLLAAGAYAGWTYGVRAGREHENAVWRRILVSWNCAGYEYTTGEWVIAAGGTCSPMYLSDIEPGGD